MHGRSRCWDIWPNPANTIHGTNVGQRRRRWVNIKTNIGSMYRVCWECCNLEMNATHVRCVVILLLGVCVCGGEGGGVHTHLNDYPDCEID